jgi:hypothetical protein
MEKYTKSFWGFLGEIKKMKNKKFLFTNIEKYKKSAGLG